MTDAVLADALTRLDALLLEACDREEARARVLAGDGSTGWAGVRNLVRPSMARLQRGDVPRGSDHLVPADADHRLRRLADGLGLAEEALDVVVLLLAPHLEPRYQSVYAVLQDDLAQPLPTERLVKAVFGPGADGGRDGAGSAVGAAAAASRLVRAGVVQRPPGAHAPGAQPLRLADDVVDVLRGVPRPAVAGAESWRWERGTAETGAHHRLLVVHGAGDRGAHSRELATRESDVLQVALPADPSAWLEVARTGWRLGVLTGALPVLDLASLPDDAALAVARDLDRLAAELGGRAWLLSRHPIALTVPHAEVGAPAWSERRGAWLAAAADAGVGLDTEAATRLATRYHFGAREIQQVIADAEGIDEAALDAAAARMGSAHVRHSLRTMPRRTFADVVLRDTTRESLDRLVFFVLNRDRVAQERGLAEALTVHRGPVVLFSGRSGTGKTLSAEAVAHAVGRPLHTVNLSQLVSKYIGDTEKHIDEVLDQAEKASAVLFFDEADTLFATRHENASSASEQFGNMLVGYLLQRIETHDGLVILSTNLRHAIDEAFLRRFHFRIEFPLPMAAEREAIWDLLLPSGEARGGDLELPAIAREHRLAGGDIRNAALRAVFLAEQRGDVVGRKDVEQAVALEMLELGRLSRRKPDEPTAPDRGELLRAFVDDLTDRLEEYLRARFLKEIHVVHGSPTDERLAGKRPAVSVAFFRLASRRGQGGLRAGFVVSAWSHVAEEESELLGVVDEALSHLTPAPAGGRPTTMRVQESNDFDLLHRFWSSHGHPVRPSLVVDAEIG